jgi:hypothetical protein
MKVVINTCHGGFCLSDAAIARYLELADLTMTKADEFYDRDIPRDDDALIQVVEEMGGMANGSFANLKIVEIPNDVNWYIEDYDGQEWVAERHRTWSN